MFHRYAYRKIDQLTPIVSETEQIRNCGNSLFKQLIESDKDLFGDGSLVALSTPGHTPGHQSLLVHLEKTGYVDQHWDPGVGAPTHLNVGHSQNNLSIALNANEGIGHQAIDVGPFGTAVCERQRQTQHQTAARGGSGLQKAAPREARAGDARSEMIEAHRQPSFLAGLAIAASNDFEIEPGLLNLLTCRSFLNSFDCRNRRAPNAIDCVMQERVGDPPKCTVQAPQSAMPQPNFDAGHAEDVSKHPQQRRVTVNTAVRSTPLTLIVKAMVVSWLAIRCSNGQGGERE
jgi:hypothetical protein